MLPYDFRRNISSRNESKKVSFISLHTDINKPNFTFMKYVNTSLTVIAVGLVMACSDTPEPQGGSTPVSSSEAIQSAPAIQPASSDSMVPVPNPGTTAPGMNPPHGQPNHRCDIAVGAPLNSFPGKAPSTQTTPPPVNTTPQATQTQTAPGMNPPHGQPNHRCDIAVGAPLDSPPGKAPTTQATPPPVNTTPQSTQTQTAPGMNPPHGQPNHRCDIAVGAPLDSPPGKKPEAPKTNGTSTTPDSTKSAVPPKTL
jgi:hypothetical protein